MKHILIGLLFATQTLVAQKVSKDDKKVIANLKITINFLADDKLEGRRTGSAGEKLAYEFIQKEFVKAGLQTFTTDKNYVQAFEVNEGKEIDSNSYVKIGDKQLKIKEDFIPLSFSKIGFAKQNDDHSSKIWIVDIGDTLNYNKDNPHFDLTNALIELTKSAIKSRVNVLFLKNTSLLKDEISFNQKYKGGALDIPVIYLTKKGEAKFNESTSKSLFSLDLKIKEKKRVGHNVIGYINNNATNTIILGAHYDHLGYGEDHNSLHTDSTPAIHNGADDNASGTAALIEIGKYLKKSAYKKFNYLFVSFSGEELGLFGSKYFTEHAGLDLKTVNYMINMDMVGRLNDSTKGITIGGYGTSPTWGKLIKKEDAYFKINIDSSGSGPSDHTSFYKKDIPVLFFFTGSHKDYHKPSDDADKINYNGELQIIKYIQNIIAQTNNIDKLAFTKTREVSMGKSSFKVSVGIMPDYTFTGNGVKVDGVSENKSAQKAGVQTGDVLMQLGDHKFSDVQSYMGVLNKFEKGQSTTLKLMRGMQELVLSITF
jgi:aminopeptidase YwaD